VFPDARLKVFLTASDEERARRRQRDEAASARDVDVDDVRSALVRRDAIDSGRVASPLRLAMVLPPVGCGGKAVLLNL